MILQAYLQAYCDIASFLGYCKHIMMSQVDCDTASILRYFVQESQQNNFPYVHLNFKLIQNSVNKTEGNCPKKITDVQQGVYFNPWIFSAYESLWEYLNKKFSLLPPQKCKIKSWLFEILE
jgi:hypothetical protein